ncbi:hypothetical protein OSC27_14190 [Microbacterium sp. STN6]|uniref:DUF7665 family protein n=1 Tax=Microbacterium sp. STN6 TaxID=2995588 RepID=UPI0022609801|nr:hypothetical protein [Microbacterium sp. STN6]MCX7523421.1 hypothetical protein [Microbacterium sp. STN6]
MTDTVDPARAAIEEDLQSVPFLDGVEKRYWRVVRVDFPMLLVAVTTGDGRELGMRLDVSGYPTDAPAGTPWNIGTNEPLELAALPSGSAAQTVFRSEWSRINGWTPYMATERLLIQGDHPQWGSQHPERAWNPSRTITFYLSELHKELRSCTMPETAA